MNTLEVVCYRNGQRILVKVNGYSKLTPKSAIAAMTIAFGGRTGKQQYVIMPDASYGYDIYPNSIKRFKNP
jgi:hypothetical protein